MITVRMHLPPAHDRSSDQEDREFQKKLAELVASRASRRQLGDRFVRVLPGAKAESDWEPLALDFEFTGNNHHGAEYSAGPFIRDLAAELRAQLGYPPMRISKIEWDD